MGFSQAVWSSSSIGLDFYVRIGIEVLECCFCFSVDISNEPSSFLVLCIIIPQQLKLLRHGLSPAIAKVDELTFELSELVGNVDVVIEVLRILLDFRPVGVKKAKGEFKSEMRAGNCCQ